MMKYLGTVINQNTQEIKITTDPYSDSLKEIHDTGSMKGRNLDQQETKSLRHLSGQLNWIVTQTRPDIAYENCIIGISISTATVREIHLANKTVRKVKTHSVSLNFPSKFNLQSSRIVGYTDASFGNLPDCGSQGAHVIFLCDNQGSYVLMTWQSRKIRRATNSTLAAECIAAVETAESCFHLQTLIQELLDKGNDSQKVPIHIFCDNRSLVDAVHTSTAVKNKRLQIEVGILREMLKKSEIEEFRWISTNLQIANPLTKAGCSCETLYQILKGNLSFRPESGQFM